MSRTVLLNPGPVNVTDRVRQALMLPDICHREKEFSDLIAAIRSKSLKVFNIEKEYTSVLVSGSGTAALEMAVSSSLSPSPALLSSARPALRPSVALWRPPPEIT